MKNNIKAVVSALGLEQKGKYSGDKFIMNCPFHNDKNPSFNIYSYNNEWFYKCFSCSEKGHINNLFKKYKGKSYNSYFNLNTYNDTNFYTNGNNNKILRKVKLSELKLNGKIYPIYLNDDLRVYLNNRNIFDDFIEYFDIKYLKCLDKGLFKYPVYNRFIIPIKNLENKIISYEFRAYKQSNKKLLYPTNSKHKSIIFNINNLDFNKPVYLTEGILDLCNLFILGYRNIGCFFNNDISDEQFELLKKFKEINIFMDNDEGGEKLVSLLYEKLEKEFFIIKPKEYKQDPGDLTLHETEILLKNKILSIDYMLNKYDLDYKEKNINW